jgi:type I restriction enzyme S subunit
MRIKDIALQIFSGGTPSTQVPEYWDGSLNWLSSGETSNTFITDTYRKITERGVEGSSTKLARVGDVVIASAGQGLTRGQTAYLLVNTYINQSIIAIRANPKFVLSKYLFYNLSTRYEEMRRLSDSSSTRGSLTTKLIGNLEIDLPSLEKQRHIVGTTSSLP